ncbi:MAG TPA: PQQ-like beta-propeller repeat protein [Gemmatales bacterium]|nr:PQQ-like beta-propeller repeat protein [Gemmatales bacterium]HMP60888.1 PQQ-like beta-propeller repeat protein [Gemmatales bacterium]
MNLLCRGPLVTLMILMSGLMAFLVGDWPQHRGPARDAIAAPQRLLAAWPADGPPLMWKQGGNGVGYSGPAIVGNRLVLLGMVGDKEVVIARSLADGGEVWRTTIGPVYHNDFGDGPRSTPTIDGAWVYALGASGDLACLSLATGTVRWQMNILQTFEGENITWGISESPLVVGARIFVTPGGRRATMVALDKESGKVLWQGKDPGREIEPAGYASPIAITVDGEEQVTTFTSQGAVGFRLADGAFLWRYDQVANGTANIATPLWQGGKLFFTSDYGTGCALLEPSGSGAKEVYFNKNLKNHHGGVVANGGYVYGFDASVLTCLELETGAVQWRHRSVGKGSVALADGLLYLFSENGVVGLARPVPSGYEEISRFTLESKSNQKTWTHPVLAHGRLLLRDQDQLWCFDVAAR